MTSQQTEVDILKVQLKVSSSFDSIQLVAIPIACYSVDDRESSEKNES